MKRPRIRFVPGRAWLPEIDLDREEVRITPDCLAVSLGWAIALKALVLFVLSVGP